MAIALTLAGAFALWCVSILIMSKNEERDRNRIPAVLDTRMMVAVIDTGLDLNDPRFKAVLCKTGHKDFTDTELTDRHGHGTHVAGIILKGAPDTSKYCLVILKFYTIEQTGFANLKAETRAIRYANTLGAKIINVSLYGPDSDSEEEQVIAESTAVIVASAGNGPFDKNQPGEDYKGKAYPASYPKVRVIGNWDCKNNRRHLSSNFGAGVIYRCGTNIVSTLPGGKTGRMTGTSQAAPAYTADLINQLTKGQ